MNKTIRTPVRLAAAAAVALVTFTGCATSPGGNGSTAREKQTAMAAASIDLSAQLQQVERKYAARIGVSAIDTGTGETISYRADERFGYTSSIKVLVAAGFLSVVPAGERNSVVTWTQEDIDAAGYSPVTSAHINDGLPLSQLAEAAVRDSDNTAANIILKKIGGPANLQELLLRHAEDETSTIVNYEPDLNSIEPGSTYDTTSPAAFTADLRSFLIGSALEKGDRATLLDWMSGNATGDPLIRAGAPAGWIVADKSGGAGGIRNDIAIVTPPDRAPIIITILTVKNAADNEYENATVADTAKIVLGALRD